MAKWYGVIGYVEPKETSPGIWEDEVIEREYCGDVLQNNRRYQSSGQVNDDLEISNRISILSDSFAEENVRFMKYISFMGTKWKITNVEILYPRLTLTIGGVYNGPQTTSA